MTLTLDKVTTFDYSTQRWVEGLEAAKLLVVQLTEELKTLEAQGAVYLSFIGATVTPEVQRERLQGDLNKLIKLINDSYLDSYPD